MSLGFKTDLVRLLNTKAVAKILGVPHNLRWPNIMKTTENHQPGIRERFFDPRLAFARHMKKTMQLGGRIQLIAVLTVWEHLCQQCGMMRLTAGDLQHLDFVKVF